MNLFSLAGKTALLTGAAGFFGRYFAKALLEAGVCKLIIIDRKQDKLFSLHRELDQQYGINRVCSFAVDQYQYVDTSICFRNISNRYAVDVLVNNSFDFSQNTGFNVQLESISKNQALSCLEAGIYWAFQATQFFGSFMKQNGGSIINICSMYALVVPYPKLYEGTTVFNSPLYSAAKAGLLHHTKYFAAFLAPRVRVNAISPGAIPNVDTLETNNPPDTTVLDRLREKILLNRMGHPTDLIGALVFLASDASSYITGQNIVIDGGLTVT